ncbi:hypothetical protein, partial [Candidatus Albibeggiatoa sp. nov. BB20]|uniref:hypothetical protein n=1 Tax=Candidatus Albibeggiatoa sp. nov. BB20 TaxID=3162723 RepID=UPI0033654C74
MDIHYQTEFGSKLLFDSYFILLIIEIDHFFLGYVSNSLNYSTKQPPAKDGWVRGLAAESRDTGRPSPVVIKELV